MADKTKVILIEDEVAVSNMYSQLLTIHGFEVVPAYDGEEGLKKVQDIKPDMVLLDIMLPKMHGLEVLKHLKEAPDTKNIPVIMLTNLSDNETMNEAMSLGPVAYLVKSYVTPKDILDNINKFLPNSTSTVNPSA